MTSVAALVRALFLTNVRNRQGLFWTFFFPVLLMVVFGLLGNLGSFRVHLAVAGPPGPTRRQIASDFARVPLFSVTQMGVAPALQAVRSGHEDVALVLPADAPPAAAPLHLDLRYNDANFTTAQQAVAAVEAAVAQIDVALSGRPPALAVTARAVSHSLRYTYLDFLVPGILALMIMQNSLFTIGAGLTRWKEKGVLRRFLATPLSPAGFLAAVVVNNILFSLVSLAIIVGIAVGVLHAVVSLPPLPLLAVVVLGLAVFLGIGFIVAGVTRTQEATIPIINLISFPMMFLSGIWFPVSNLPAFLRHIVEFFPLTYLVDGLRSLMTGAATGLSANVAVDALGLAAWLVACSVLAARTWRWE